MSIVARKVSTGVLFLITITLSAGLLFILEPLIGKYILPRFGGASAVWSVCLLFFTVMLFGGYLYASFIARLPPLKALRIHTAVLAVSGVLILAEWLLFRIPLLPDTLMASELFSSLPPSLSVLTLMFIAIGLPFFVLSTTSTMIQLWGGMVEGGKVPYRYYAFSNAASLAGLLAYPFLIEPYFSLHTQAVIWGVCFALYLAFYIIAARRVHTLPHSDETSAITPGTSLNKVTLREFVMWTMLPALPAFLLVATTASITRDVAPIPLLWILPLAAYLISFIFAFSTYRITFSSSVITTVSIFLMLFLSTGIYKHPFVIIVDIVAFLCIALFLHAELYARRPDGGALAQFYLALSLGGALGTIVAALITPLIFVYPLEFPIAIIVVLMFVLLRLFALNPFGTRAQQRALAVGFPIVLLLGVFFLALAQNNDTIKFSRNFYGTLRVIEREAGGNAESMRILGHGEIIHGTQFTDPLLARVPTVYFSHTGGAGRVLLTLAPEAPRGLSVGIIGLGVGTLAAYCTPDDHYTFYEINDAITDIAYEYFTYLNGCEHQRVISGDARLVMEDEIARGEAELYDVFVVDAFSGDSVPAHLLTKEAFALYRARLRDEKSVLLVHITNRYLDLAPVVFAGGAANGLSGVLVQDNPDLSATTTSPGASASTWVALSLDTHLLDMIRGGAESEKEVRARSRAVLWTDDASNLLSVVKFFNK